MIEADVVVVGAGAAGLAAANAAAAAGAEVVVVEASGTIGGTSVKSSGGVLIFGNRFHREAGIEEDREQSIRLMAKTSFPELYDSEAQNLGLDQRDLALIETYYDASARVFEELEREGTLTLRPQGSLAGDPRGFPSYFGDQPEETIAYGRTIATVTPDGAEGFGRELIRQLLSGAERKRVDFFPAHRVIRILREDGDVIGIETSGPDGPREFLGRKGVVFGTGGFTHDRELMDRHMPGYVPGGGAAREAQGDLVSLCAELDVELDHMDKAWWAEIPVELALSNPAPPALLFFPFGDSMIYVDGKGQRVVNEKLPYDRRAKAHFAVDEKGQRPNELLFMVYDKEVADSGDVPNVRWPMPGPKESAPYVIEAQTLEDLADAIRGRLDGISAEVGGFQLADDFGPNLKRTVTRFNGFAESGRDDDFGRGTMPIEFDATGMHRQGNHPNQTMYPFSATGPYYAMIVAAATLDTKGGPRIDTKAQIVRRDGSPIPGLYGAGNCVASPSADGYWSGGATLGIAITFGHIAGTQAASREIGSTSRSTS